MESRRPKDKRQNQGVLVTGATGSGKSRMCARLAAYWQRVLFVDPTGSFDAASVARNWAEAKTVIARDWPKETFTVACRLSTDDDYKKLFGGIAALAQSATVHHSTCVVLDEVDLWSTSHSINPALSGLLRYGRHHGISWLANCRFDVDTNRDIRGNATQILLFRQGMLSPDMQRRIRSAERLRNEEFAPVESLTAHGPKEAPQAIEGIHFIAVPERFSDWLPTWEQVAQAK